MVVSVASVCNVKEKRTRRDQFGTRSQETTETRWEQMWAA